MKSKKALDVQVFLIGDSTSEITGTLVKYEQIPEIQALKFGTTDDTGYYSEHIVPMSQIRMIRLYTIEEE